MNTNISTLGFGSSTPITYGFGSHQEINLHMEISLFKDFNMIVYLIPLAHSKKHTKYMFENMSLMLKWVLGFFTNTTKYVDQHLIPIQIIQFKNY